MSLENFGNFLTLDEKHSFIKNILKNFIQRILNFLLQKISIIVQELNFHFIMTIRFFMRCLIQKTKKVHYRIFRFC